MVTEKLIKARTQLQIKNTFFGRLILALDFREDTSVNTMGINHKGIVVYNKDFIENINGKELIGVMAHELLHLALLHHFRFAGKIHEISNIAEDICINAMLIKDNYKLPMVEIKDEKGNVTDKVNGLVPDVHDTIELDFSICKINIKDCSQKSAEMIYEEIIKSVRKHTKNISLSNESLDELNSKEGEQLAKGIKEVAKKVIDEHKKINKGGMSKKERDKAQKQVEGMIREALELSKMRGDTPSGLDRIWGELNEEKFDWKTLLQRYITELLPYDQSWRNFGKKTYGTGIYSPMTLREQINVSVAIDVSGSIEEKDLTEFMSEIVGVAKQFKNRIKMTIITHESEVIDTFSAFNDDDVKNIKIRGCGGTSFEPVVDYVKENIKETKCLLWLTDGYGEKKLERQPFNIIWVLTEDGEDDLCRDSGKILWLKD